MKNISVKTNSKIAHGIETNDADEPPDKKSPTTITRTAREVAVFIRENLPTDIYAAKYQVAENGGLPWRTATELFPLSREIKNKINDLGPALVKLHRALNNFYFLSANEPKLAAFSERQRERIKFWRLILNHGKHPWTTSNPYSPQAELPLIIRPDLIILPDEKLMIAEIDAEPWGWGELEVISRLYNQLGSEPYGEGIAHAFRQGLESLNANRDGGYAIVISEESAGTLPEMEELTRLLQKENFSCAVIRPSEVTFKEDAANKLWAINQRTGERIGVLYRAFELFDADRAFSSALPVATDWEKFKTEENFRRSLYEKQTMLGPETKSLTIGFCHQLMVCQRQKTLTVVNPLRHYFEEKSLAAMIHDYELEPFWQNELGEDYFFLRDLFPKSWVAHPSYRKLPQGAALRGAEDLPGCGIEEMILHPQAGDLLLKISGFNMAAWGCRSVAFLDTLSRTKREELNKQIWADYGQGIVWLIQEAAQPKKLPVSYWNYSTDSPDSFSGYARINPYYFIINGRAHLSGVDATLRPAAEGRKVHLTSSAVYVPAG